jgi:signal peptide peptidase SppA
MLCKIIKKIKKDDKALIAVIRLNGVIGKVSFNNGMSLDSLKYLDKIAKIKNLKALAVIINSPGGSPVQSELIAKKISNIAKSYKKKLPIFTFCEDVAASGGYWLACMGEEIFASRSSIIGSVGVISQGFGFVEAIEKIGIERRVFSQGKNKSVLDPFSKTKDDDIAIIHDIQKDIHNAFIEFIKSSRKDRLKSSDEELFNGRFWSGSKAVKLGLIDGIGCYEEVLKEKYGENCIFKEISSPKSFLQKKISAMLGNIYNDVSYKIKESIISTRYKL